VLAKHVRRIHFFVIVALCSQLTFGLPDLLRLLRVSFVSSGIEAILPASYPPHKWLGTIITALNKTAVPRDTYEEQLQDKADLLKWQRSNREKDNLLKYDGGEDDLLTAVTKMLHLYYRHLNPTVVSCLFDSRFPATASTPHAL
jgi:hypothetical protein